MKYRPRNTTVQLSIPYADPKLDTVQRVTDWDGTSDRRTDRRTDSHVLQ